MIKEKKNHVEQNRSIKKKNDRNATSSEIHHFYAKIRCSDFVVVTRPKKWHANAQSNGKVSSWW